MSDFKNPIISAPIPKNFTQAFSFELSAGIDGIFDFIKNDKSSFGMILRINGGAGMLIPFQEANDYIQGALHCSYGLFSNIRAGFQIGMPTSFIDFVAEVPFISTLVLKSPYNSTLTLGYKYLF